MEKSNPLLLEGESTLHVVVSDSDYLEFLEKEKNKEELRSPKGGQS